MPYPAPRRTPLSRVLWGSCQLPLHLSRSLIRSLNLPLPLPLLRRQVLSSPAFWAAPGDPASPNQRGRNVVTGRVSTTLIGRRRPPTEPGEMTSRSYPREPGTAFCDT